MAQRQASLSQKKLIITNNKKQKDLNFIRKKLIIGNDAELFLKAEEIIKNYF